MCVCCTDHFSWRAIDTGVQIALVYLSDPTKTNGPTHTKNKPVKTVLLHFLSLSFLVPVIGQKFSMCIYWPHATYHFTGNKTPLYQHIKCGMWHQHCHIFFCLDSFHFIEFGFSWKCFFRRNTESVNCDKLKKKTYNWTSINDKKMSI